MPQLDLCPYKAISFVEPRKWRVALWVHNSKPLKWGVAFKVLSGSPEAQGLPNALKLHIK